MVAIIETHLSLPAEPTSASRARSFVRETLAAWGAEDLEEPATLLTSELVTNAVLHARSAAEVTLRLDDGELWVGVSDANSGSPVRKRYGPEAATGRGLLLIERIASAWGTDLSSSGKVVWFRLAVDAGRTPMVASAADFEADLAELGIDPAPGAGGGGLHHERPAGPQLAIRRRVPPLAPAGVHR